MNQYRAIKELEISHKSVSNFLNTLAKRSDFRYDSIVPNSPLDCVRLDSSDRSASTKMFGARRHLSRGLDRLRQRGAMIINKY